MQEKTEECRIVFTVSREAMEELFRICSSSWEVWKNHATTAMPQLETSPSALARLPDDKAAQLLFQLFCASPKRLVLIPDKKTSKIVPGEYFCQPLAFVVFPDYKTGHGLRTPDIVIRDRTGTSDELSLTFISILKALGSESAPSIVRLENKDGASRYCTLLPHAGMEMFIDLVSGLLASFDEGTICENADGKTIAGRLFSLVGLGGGNSKSENALSAAYRAAEEPADWKITHIFRTDAALNFFWHFQNARKIASPLVNGDIISMASDNPAALTTVKSMSGADFSQVVSELSCAINAFAQIQPENARTISEMAEKAKKALAALN